MKFDPKLLILLPFGLAACSDDGAPGRGAGVDLSDLAEQAEGLLEEGELTQMPGARTTLEGIVAANALAATGSTSDMVTATYRGGLLAAPSDDEFAISANIELQANFGDGLVSGSITDVHDSDDGLIDSDLSVAGTITTDRLTASISGQLDPGEDDAVDITGDLTGEFRGENAEWVAGGVTIEGEDPLDGPFRIDGAWSASKQ